ncbi:MAG: DUF4139 domain-containing protein [Myxococcales bacterium]|nr:DUF4139 domain-containing protein [Myxococcales bacterium]
MDQGKSAALPQSVASRIAEVLVYRQGARVQRVATIRSPAERGPRIVRIGSLPLELDDATCRVALEGEGDPLCSELRIVLDVPAEHAELESAPLEERAEALRLRLRGAERELEVCRQALGCLDALAPLPRYRPEDAPAGPSPTAARLSLLRLRADAQQAGANELRALEAKIREHSEALRELEHAIRQAGGPRTLHDHEVRKAALLTMEGGRGELTLTLEYDVPGARWAPSYALHVNATMDAARLDMRALVAQQTGEDWRGARLSLCTSRPQAWAALPALPSLRIGRQQPAPPSTGWRPAPEGADALYEDYDRAFAPPPAQTAPSGSIAGARGLRAELGEAVIAGPPGGGMGAAARGAASPPEAPPPPAAAPQPAPLPALEAASMDLMAGASPPEAESRAPSRRSKRRASPPSGDPSTVSLQDAFEQAPADEAPAPLEPEAHLLEYGRMRMPRPDARSRSRLRPTGQETLLFELLSSLRLQVKVDLRSALEVSRGRLHEFMQEPLPGGAKAPSAPPGYDYAYVAELPVEIPSAQGFRLVPLLSRECSIEPHFIVVPRMSKDAYRAIRFENPLDAPLLDGPVDVYIGRDFLTSTPLQHVPIAGSVQLGLGVDQSVKVSRNARFEEESRGLIRSERALVHVVEIELRSLRKRSSRVEVRERLPVSREKDEAIEVKVGEVRPPWEPFAPERSELEGGRRWRVELPAGGQIHLAYEYTILLASKHELEGGDRREPS